jgi:hypothetical protein
MSGIQILASDSYGIYVPQKFASNYNWSGINVEDLDIIEQGPTPENEWYWEAWSNVLNDAFHKDKEGNTWRLYQDGDLFAYCEDLMDDEEYYNLFGEKRQ